MYPLRYETMKALQGFLLSLAIVAAVALFGRIARADGPPQQVIENAKRIEENQAILKETRDAHNRFMEAKEANERMEKENNALGWCTDWSTLKPIPCPKAVHATQAKVSTIYAWKGAPAYKNERLTYYQEQLIARGITNKEHLKLLTAQVIQENGSLSENVHGDGGCSVGILQYNACVHHGVSAKKFLEKHPEWKSWQYQLDRMADMVADRYHNLYAGNIKQVIVHHNRPVDAKRNRDTPAGYYRTIAARTSLLTSL